MIEPRPVQIGTAPGGLSKGNEMMGDRVSKLNKTTSFYSLREVDKILGTLVEDQSMYRVIQYLQQKHVQYSTETIREVGKQLGLGYAAEAVIDALEKERTKTGTRNRVIIAGDDDVLTVGQLREGMHEVVKGFSAGRWIATGSVDDFIDQVMERVSRPWIAGDIVKDAVGNWYKRTDRNQWMIFGQNGYVSDASPVRPLTKMN